MLPGLLDTTPRSTTPRPCVPLGEHDDLSACCEAPASGAIPPDLLHDVGRSLPGLLAPLREDALGRLLRFEPRPAEATARALDPEHAAERGAVDDLLHGRNHGALQWISTPSGQ